MNSKLLFFITLLSLFGMNIFAQDIKQVYWADAGINEFVKAGIDGSGQTTLWDLTEEAKLSIRTTSISIDPIDIDVDFINGIVYGITQVGKIFKCDLDGNNLSFVSTDITQCFALALNSTNNKLYFTTSQSNGDIYSINTSLVGGAAIVLNDMGMPIYGIAVDPNSSKIYFATGMAPREQDFSITDKISGSKVMNGFSENSIYRSDLDGSNYAKLIDSEYYVFGIDLDLTNGKIYWLNYTIPLEANKNIIRENFGVASGKINKADLDGSNVENILSGLTRPFGISLDVDMNKLYFSKTAPETSVNPDVIINKYSRDTKDDPGQIYSANFDGTGPAALFNVSDPYGLQIQNQAPENQAPVLENIERGEIDYTTGQGGATLTETMTVNDADDAYLESATVQITSNYVDGEDVLYYSAIHGITGNWNAATGKLTLSGSAKKLYYKNALHSVQYVNYSSNPSLEQREISFIVNDGDASSNTAIRKINVLAPSLQAPTNLTITFDSNGNIVLTWQDNSGNEIGFTIEREAAASSSKARLPFSFEVIGTVETDVTTFTDETVLEGETYNYRVSAFNDEESSGFVSGENGSEMSASAPINTPTDLSAESNEDGTISLIWEDNSSIEDGYKVLRKTTGSWEEIAQVGADEFEYTDTDVINGTLYSYYVKAFNTDLESQPSNEAEVTSMIVGVEVETGIPTDFTLSQNYPNPFNPSTIIEYGLPEESHVILKIYNMIGQQVAELVNRFESTGYHTVSFDASNLTSGIYFYKIEAGNYMEIKKMILLR